MLVFCSAELALPWLVFCSAGLIVCPAGLGWTWVDTAWLVFSSAELDLVLYFTWFDSTWPAFHSAALGLAVFHSDALGSAA